MIELTIFYPAEESASAELIVFSVYYRGHLKEGRAPGNLTLALSYVEGAVSDIDGILDIDASDEDNGDLSVAYDPSVAPWRQWYITAIDAIKSYYADTFDDHSIEVVHNIRACNVL